MVRFIEQPGLQSDRLGLKFQLFYAEIFSALSPRPKFSCSKKEALSYITANIFKCTDLSH